MLEVPPERGSSMAGTTDLTWRRSNRCDSGSCVEIATDGDRVLLRDSADPGGHVLIFTQDEWQAFVTGLKEADFTT
jgi:hypothetical protein